MKNSFSSRIFVLLAFMSASLVSWAGTSTNQANGILQIEAEIFRQSETNIILNIAVKNIGSKDVLIPNGYLPWDRYAMSLVLVGTDPASTPLQQELVIADPMPGDPWKLKKGDSLKGNIDLTDRFPQLPKVLKHTEVIVFWSYQLEAEEEMKFDRIAGWKVIPKLTSPSPK